MSWQNIIGLEARLGRIREDIDQTIREIKASRLINHVAISGGGLPPVLPNPSSVRLQSSHALLRSSCVCASFRQAWHQANVYCRLLTVCELVSRDISESMAAMICTVMTGSVFAYAVSASQI